MLDWIGTEGVREMRSEAFVLGLFCIAIDSFCHPSIAYMMGNEGSRWNCGMDGRNFATHAQ
jgi:hypothetical protein